VVDRLDRVSEEVESLRQEKEALASENALLRHDVRELKAELQRVRVSLEDHRNRHKPSTGTLLTGEKIRGNRRCKPQQSQFCKL
jgi:regulator of replication initiation timing